ncbi:hypothetical protein C9374_010870 [Naegleria lovaniensis]|uniref:Uncharacterized protein n=1 Tax=Naegleria lovaniensis TaxID=51637 RepID=A0AA88KD00_NAELO|nr:uncharacterized protein C9374_010870 [Naegleria lovaniensis]KAG2374300.1 hypothetical protein C9374_010870 [Naegleria lovaniensis]
MTHFMTACTNNTLRRNEDTKNHNQHLVSSTLPITSWTCEQVQEWIQKLEIHDTLTANNNNSQLDQSIGSCDTERASLYSELVVSTKSVEQELTSSPACSRFTSSNLGLPKQRLHSLKDAIPYFKFHSILGIDLLELRVNELEEMFYEDFSTSLEDEEEIFQTVPTTICTTLTPSNTPSCHYTIPIPCDPNDVQTRHFIQKLYHNICNLKQQHEQMMAEMHPVHSRIH